MNIHEWMFTDNYKSFSTNPYKNKWANIKIIYKTEPIKIGNENFNFRQYDKPRGEKEIACFGCSQTFGVGLPDEWTWPYYLNELFGDSYNVKNYGIAGSCNELIARFCHEFIINQNKNYEAVFCFFPDTYRYLYGLYENDKLITADGIIQNNPQTTDLKNLHLANICSSYLNLTNESFSFFRFIKSYKLIKEICDSKNIPLYWYSWSENINNLSEEIKDEFLDGYRFINEKDLKKLRYKSIARDYQHIGEEYTKRLAESFYEKHIKTL
jgi:hypothetical protein